MNHSLRNRVIFLAKRAYYASSYEDFRILFHFLDETGQILLLGDFKGRGIWSSDYMAWRAGAA